MFRKSSTKPCARRRLRRKHRRYGSPDPTLRFESLEDRRLLAVFHPSDAVADGGAGSLRAAIIAANSNNEDDVIFLAAGRYTLSDWRPLDQPDAQFGDLDLTEAGTSITIRGDGAASTIINTEGNFTDRVLQIGTDVNAVIEGITITGGNAAYTDGGGIFNQGHLTIRDTRISDNSTTHLAFGPNEVRGGGIFNAGTLEISNSTISDNSVDNLCFSWCGSDFNQGAGIYNSGTLLVTGSSITNNHSVRSGSSTADFSAGGGLANSGTATLIDTSLTRNKASQGGGAYNTGTLTLDAATLSNNTPDDLFNDGGTVIVVGAPEAADDAYTVDEDGVLSVAASGLLANDRDPNGDPLSAVLTASPAHGTLSLRSDGSFDYTPDADYNGSDAFTYKAHDGANESDEATVVVQVQAVNDAPTATDDTFYVAPGEVLRVAVTRSVLVNDGDIENDPLSAVLVDGPTNGELELLPDGTFSYTPAAEFSGVDNFRYLAHDGDLDSNVVTVTIHVETIQVTTTEDEDDGLLGGGSGVSLREAIRYSPRGAVIDVPAGDYLLTRKGAFENAGATGDLDLVHDLTLRGAGADVTTVNAAPLAFDSDPVAGDRVFHILPGALASIRGLTLTGGRPDVSSGFNPGGALLNEGELSVSDSILHGNRTVGFDKILTQNGEIRRQLSGGAVHNTGILTVTGTVLADNGVLKRVRTCPGAFVSCHIGHVTGGEGGGIWNSGQLTLIDSQISDNKAHNGGGISNKGQMWVTDVVFSDNLANDFGGAIHSISLATDVLTRVTVSGNSALYGGGINTFGEFAVRDSNFRNNSAVPGAGLSDGGGLLIQDTGHGTISGTTFHGNTADLGGGLHVYSGGRLHLINSTISGNSASTMGGGIINRYSGNLTLTHVTLTDNFSALAGGGLYAEYHPVVINNSIVAGNRHDGGEGADINGAVNAKFSLVEDSDYVFFLDDGEELIDPAWAGNVTNVRPRLSPLQDNGGLSWTHALMSQSPAIDAAANALSVDDNGDPLDSDQRGLERIADGGSGNIADMGAYELPQSLPPGNDPPSVVDDSYTMEAGATLVVPAADGVLVNDHDPESDFFSAVLERGPQNGQLILAADGSFTYQPQAGFTGVDGFTYVADDGQDRSAEATVTITVAAPNQPPTAVDDEYTVDQDATLTVSAPGLLANDTDADGDALVAIPLTGPAHGTLSFDFDGWFSYTPDPGFSGVDHFTYFAADDESPSNEATVTITVNAVNEAPEAGDDAYEVDQDAALTIAAPGVLSNDTDADGDPLSAVLINGPTNGTLSLDADGAFVYTPDAGFTGNDSFTYVANDGVASSAEATVSITVNAVNEAPVADDDHYRVDQDIPLIVPSAGVLENDTDADGDPLTAVLVSSPTHGTLTLQDDGSFTYVPEPGYFGTDQFTYRASDGIDPSNVAIVSIEVAQVVPPIAPKFLVVDADSTDLFEYDDQGALVGRRSLETDGAAPRGATVIADGSTRWVIDSNHDVSVYDAEGNLLGNWKADGLRRPEGIASDGQHVWIVDRATDRVYRFTDGAGLREGTHAASSDFPLVRGNRNPRGITSDGTRVWIVNDGRNRDAVFQYTTSGMPVGNWTIDDHNASPTGITVDPASASTLWIVDSAAHQIFRYDDAASRVSGSQAADAIFALAGENTNPQGIADPDLESSGTPQPGWSYSPWHNPVNWLDVSDDGVVSPFDMLLILQRLRQAAEGESGAASSIYYDVNNDGLATPLDALLILNRLSSAVPNDDPDDDADGGPEGEAFARAADAIFLDADWLPHAE